MSELIERPEFIDVLSDKSQAGFGEMSQYISPPWIKLIQDKREVQYKEFEPQSIIMVPDNLLLVPPGEDLLFTIVYLYDEFIIRNPYPMKATLPFKRESSFDSKSALADRCRRLEKFPCPENPKFECICQTVLHFIISVDSPVVARETLIGMSFSSTEFKSGRRLISLAQQRCMASSVKIFALNFAAVVAPRSKQGNDWYGLNFASPEDRSKSFVSNKTHYEYFKMMNEKLSKNREQIITVSDSDTETDTL